MAFSIGDRVFAGPTGKYGIVTATRLLGKNGLVIKNDDGSISAYTTARARAEIYAKDTEKNGDGLVVDIPMDVRVEGVEVLTALNILPAQQTLYFYKFLIGLTTEEQNNCINGFNTAKNNAAEKESFLTNLLATLEDDQQMIFTEGSNALFRVDPEIRAGMFQKLLVDFPKEQREALILQWLGIKPNRGEKEKFLHEMHLSLMNSDEYIKLEGERGLTEFGLGSEKQKALFGKFLAGSTSESEVAFIEGWKAVRSSRSRRRFFLKNTIRQLEASDEA